MTAGAWFLAIFSPNAADAALRPLADFATIPSRSCPDVATTDIRDVETERWRTACSTGPFVRLISCGNRVHNSRIQCNPSLRLSAQTSTVSRKTFALR